MNDFFYYFLFLLAMGCGCTIMGLFVSSFWLVLFRKSELSVDMTVLLILTLFKN